MSAATIFRTDPRSSKDGTLARILTLTRWVRLPARLYERAGAGPYSARPRATKEFCSVLCGTGFSLCAFLLSKDTGWSLCHQLKNQIS